MSHRFDHLEDSEREWLRASRQAAARRTWLLIGILVLVAIGLAWLTVGGPQRPKRPAATAALTAADRRVLQDGQKALDAWGRFPVADDLALLKDTFWTTGPQYRQLEKEAKAHRKPAGPPAYHFTLSGARVLSPAANQRVVRARVQVTRPGEVVQTYDWDIWLRSDPAAGGRWRLWTVQRTSG